MTCCKTALGRCSVNHFHDRRPFVDVGFEGRLRSVVEQTSHLGQGLNVAQQEIGSAEAMADSAAPSDVIEPRYPPQGTVRVPLGQGKPRAPKDELVLLIVRQVAGSRAMVFWHRHGREHAIGL